MEIAQVGVVSHQPLEPFDQNARSYTEQIASAFPFTPPGDCHVLAQRSERVSLFRLSAKGSNRKLDLPLIILHVIVADTGRLQGNSETEHNLSEFYGLIYSYRIIVCHYCL